MIVSISCEDSRCGWMLDIDTDSKNNPKRCPECNSEIIDSITGEYYDPANYKENDDE